MPDSAEAYLNLGQVLQRQGDAAAAAEAFSAADRINKRKGDAQASVFAVGVGRERLRQGDIDGAIAKFREAITLAADNYEAHYALALALRARGDHAAAAQSLVRARQLAPWLKEPD
jgi:tetratricopeptide (TPR) repeat protein